MTRSIEYLPVADLTPDPKNPKDHDVGLIHTSVTRFGFVEPIVLDGRTGLIVSGHGRVKTLQAMEAEGDPPPDGVTVDRDGKWLAPVATGWESANDVDAAAALIAMNRTTEMGGWVDESLLDLLEQLAAGDGLEGVGYHSDDIDQLRSYLEGHALAAGWSDDDSETADDAIDFRSGHREITVVVEEARRPDLYQVLSRLDWVIDARDKSV